MTRAVLDEVVPADAAEIFTSPAVAVARFPDPWRSLPDSILISTAEAAGFDWLVTCDKRMPYQQNLKGRSISVLVLPTPELIKLARIQCDVQTMLAKPRTGLFVILDHEGQIRTAPVAHLIGKVEP